VREVAVLDRSDPCALWIPENAHPGSEHHVAPKKPRNSELWSQHLGKASFPDMGSKYILAGFFMGEEHDSKNKSPLRKQWTMHT
jgi:hypothetical protein